MPWEWLWRHRWWGAAGAGALGVSLSVAAMRWAPSTGRPLIVQRRCVLPAAFNDSYAQSGRLVS